MKRERDIRVASGGLMLVVLFGFAGLAIWLIFAMVGVADEHAMPSSFWWLLTAEVVAWLAFSLVASGFFIVEPRGSKVLLLFGRYVGTVKKEGFHWANPFLSKRTVSLRVRTFNTEHIKVNDLNGNPVEIAAVVVWQVVDTFEASFEVDDYVEYVETQSETALRQTASQYPYDAEDDQQSLRQDTLEVSADLMVQLQERLGRAGVEVLESKLTHLAYAPEIAGAMLRRQQAAAIIAARRRIVDGAVGMVEMALEDLEKGGKIQLDDERRANMVSNLMVVLCSETAAQPVINTGTLYP